MSLKNWFRSPRTNPNRRATYRPQPRLGVQQLEAREVPTVSLLSALAAGNDVGMSRAEDVAADGAGNSYLTGCFSGTVDFDPAQTHLGDADILTSAGGTDIFVAKYAPNNSLVWAVRMGGSEMGDMARSIAVDASGNVFVTGNFSSTADFGAVSLTSAGEYDGFVVKLNSTGLVQWANRWGQSEQGEDGKGVDTDAAGNVFVIGYRVPFNRIGFGYDIRKYGPTGTQQWAKFIASGQNVSGTSDLVADAAGNTYSTGAFTDTVDFDPNQGTKWMYAGPGSYKPAGFVLKLSSAGNFGWVSTFAGQAQTVNGVTTYGSSHAQRITLDGGGNPIVGGYYSGKVDFNPGGGTTNLPTIGGAFFTKLNANGGLVWAKAIEKDASAGGSAGVYDLATDAAGNVYATGSFGGTVDFNPGAAVASRTSAGKADAYVLKLTSTGNFAWAETFGGAGDDIGWGIAVDPAGVVYFAGQFNGTVDFDPDPVGTYFLTAPGTFMNIFFVKLHQN